MAVSKIGKLTPVSVDTFMAKLSATPTLKAEVIQEILRDGAHAFLKRVFDLDSRQEGEVDLMKNRDIEEIAQRSIITALVHGWPIKVIHEGHPKPNLWIRIEIHKGGGSITVGC